jgi:RNA polymerase subunit RPABC4/transcription elongation factor Spt4
MSLMSEGVEVCKRCGRKGLVEDVMTGLKVCPSCRYGFTPSGREICPACLSGDCSNCVSRREARCSHECFYQSYYGSPEDIGFITPDDW